jgi:hypothetical protein
MISFHDAILLLTAAALLVLQIVMLVRDIKRGGQASIGVNADGTRPTTTGTYGAVYDRAFAYVDGRLLGQAESVKVDVHYQRDHLGNVTNKTLRARIISLVPKTGFEFDAFSAAVNCKTVGLLLRFGGSGHTLRSVGYINYASLVGAAVNATRLEFEFNGEPACFKTSEEASGEVVKPA